MVGADAQSAPATLPVGSTLTIVSDETVKPNVRPGSEFRAHVRDPIVIGPTLAAPAGTSARIVVTHTDHDPSGIVRYHIAVTKLDLGLAGTLPVRPVTPVVDAIVAGMTIPVRTQAVLAYDAGKVRVDVPLPFTLSNTVPSGSYTPAPLKTAAPVVQRRRRGRRSASPTPSPLPSNAVPSPDTSPTATAAPSASAGVSPSPVPSSAPGAGAPSPAPSGSPPG